MSTFEARGDGDPLPEAASELGRALDELAGLRRALEEERDRGLRLLADFENFRRREARERAAAREAGRREAVLSFLPALDALDRALASGADARDLREGVAVTRRMLEQSLREIGVAPVETVGRPFDPAVHEAVAAIPSAEVPEGFVAGEIRRGWKLGGDLLRPAQVEVAAPADAEPWR